jgi:hypothetical protein
MSNNVEKSNEFDGTIEPSDYHDLVYSFLDEWEEGEDPNDLYLTGDSDRQFAVALLHRLYTHFDHLDAGVVDAPEIVAALTILSVCFSLTLPLKVVDTDLFAVIFVGTLFVCFSGTFCFVFLVLFFFPKNLCSRAVKVTNWPGSFVCTSRPAVVLPAWKSTNCIASCGVC